MKELAKLPEPQQEDLRKVLRDEPEIDRIKDVTSTARWITKATESGVAVRAFQQGELDLEKAMQEAQRLDALGLLADAVGQAQALESAVLKLHTSWRRLGGLQERLWVESGSSTPYLRDVLSALQGLSGATLRVSLGELAGGKRVGPAGGGPTSRSPPLPDLVLSKLGAIHGVLTRCWMRCNAIADDRPDSVQWSSACSVARTVCGAPTGGGKSSVINCLPGPFRARGGDLALGRPDEDQCRSRRRDIAAAVCTVASSSTDGVRSATALRWCLRATSPCDQEQRDPSRSTPQQASWLLPWMKPIASAPGA